MALMVLARFSPPEGAFSERASGSLHVHCRRSSLFRAGDHGNSSSNTTVSSSECRRRRQTAPRPPLSHLFAPREGRKYADHTNEDSSDA